MLLQPGDLLLLSGEARHGWTHGIASRCEDRWEGEVLNRGHRVSLTLRRMLHDVHVLQHLADDDGRGGCERGDEG